MALLLNSVASSLWAQDLRESAVAVRAEAVAAFRLIAGADELLLAEFASSLTDLGIELRELGQTEDGLPPTREAADLYRQLASTDDQYLPNLAGRLKDLTVFLAKVSRFSEAYETSQECVRLCWQLAAADPSRYSAELAGALSNMAGVTTAPGADGRLPDGPG